MNPVNKNVIDIQICLLEESDNVSLESHPILGTEQRVSVLDYTLLYMEIEEYDESKVLENDFWFELTRKDAEYPQFGIPEREWCSFVEGSFAKLDKI